MAHAASPVDLNGVRQTAGRDIILQTRSAPIPAFWDAKTGEKLDKGFSRRDLAMWRAHIRKWPVAAWRLSEIRIGRIFAPR
jgi:hypothetical protein